MTRTVAAQSGFSLMEAMVASGILAIGLLALAGMQTISLTKNVDANDLTVASNLAGEMMERIQFNRMLAANNPSPYNGINTTVPGTQPNAANQPQANGDYAQWTAALTASGLTNPIGTVVVNPIVTNPPLNQFQVAVAVNWQAKERAGGFVRNQVVTLTSVLAME